MCSVTKQTNTEVQEGKARVEAGKLKWDTAGVRKGVRADYGGGFGDAEHGAFTGNALGLRELVVTWNGGGGTGTHCHTLV